MLTLLGGSAYEVRVQLFQNGEEVVLKQDSIRVPLVKGPIGLLFKRKQTVIGGRVQHDGQVQRNHLKLWLVNEET